MNNPKRILLLDDEKLWLEAIGTQIRAQGYEVLTMDWKHKAFDRLMQFRPDLILSDIRSPGMDGWEFLYWVRSNPYAANMAFVFLTGYERPENAGKWKEMGADNFISKYCDQELLETVKWELRKKAEPAWQSPARFDDCIADGFVYCLPWQWLIKRWEAAMENSPYRTAVLGMCEWCLDFVIDRGTSLSIGRLVRPFDPRNRYSAREFHSLIDEYGAENGIFYVLTPHNDHDAVSSRARIATPTEMTEVFSSRIFSPDLSRFET